MVNIISPNVNNITSFKVHFSPKQEGTGDPSPENVREIVGWDDVEVHTRGKNLLKYWKNGYYSRSGGYFYPGANNAGFYPIRVKKTDSIYFSVIAPIASGSIAFFTDEYDFNPDTFISQKSIASSETGRITRKIEPPQDCWMYLQIDYQSKRTAENAFEKEPQIEIGSSPTNYEPNQSETINYSFYNQEIDCLDPTMNWYIGEKGTYRLCEFIDKEILRTVTVTVKDSSIDSSNMYFGFSGDANNANTLGYTWVIEKGQLTGRNTNEVYYPTEYKGNYCRYFIVYPSTDEVFNTLRAKYDIRINGQDFFGGYVDLVTGELVQTYHCYQITGQETFTNVGSNWVTIYVSPQGMQASLTKNGFCTHYPYSPYTKDAIGVMFNEHTVTFDQRIGDATYWKNFCTKQYNNGTPVTLVYEIKTPFTAATLSPTQLSTLKGQNNFWSNADYVEIEYELTETFDIQKAKRKIILNQPHVESTSGTIAKPETDMIGKIKECKIHFMPVQQGDGDPTPDNIVPVTGWTGIDVYQAFVEYPITPIVNTTTGYGVKWVVDKDGLMTAYGTPTAYTGASLGMIDVNGDETLYGVITGSLNNVTFNKPTLLDSNGHSINYSAGDGILISGLDLSLYNDVKRIRVALKRSGNVFMSGSCNAIIWKDKKPTISTTSIDWTDIAGTIYGGYVDLISGKLVVTQIIIKDKWGNWEQSGVLDNHVRKTHDFQYTVKGGSASQYCLSNVTSNYVWSNSQDTAHYYVSSTGRLAYMILPTDFDENTDVEVVGTLVEPITYQLTPQQLTTLRGINNIWSSANGEVEIKYWKH